MSAPQTVKKLACRNIFGYYGVVTAVLLAASPVLVWVKKTRAGLAQKLGAVPESLKARGTRPRLWFHSVSVGEFNALLPLIEELRHRYPQYELCISTTTATGQELALKKAGEFARVFYFPFDLPVFTGSFLDAVRPELVGIVETEIWPGFMDECARREIPVVLLNGRLSPRSHEGYMRWQWFFAPVIKQFQSLCLQSESELRRFESLAGETLPAVITGNIKFDGLKPVAEAESSRLRDELGLSPSDTVLVAGSTHEGEEQALLDLAKELDVKLIIAPRHPERFERVAELVGANGFTASRFSQGGTFENHHTVYVLDTIGQLSRFYSIAQLAFVGGTLVPVGGHNLAEPCVYGVPVVSGSHVHKQKDLANSLSECGALCIAADASEMKRFFAEFANDDSKRLAAGEKGRVWLAGNQGAVHRTLSVLEKFLKPSPVKVSGGARQ